MSSNNPPKPPRRARRADQRAEQQQAVAPPQPQIKLTQAPNTGLANLNFESLYQGPVPPPEYIAVYEQHYPDAGREFIAMAREEATHRHQLETRQIAMQERAVVANVQLAKRGQLIAFVIALFFGAMSGFLIYQGHDGAGVALGSIDLVGLVGVFALGQFRPGRSSKTEGS